MEYGERYRAVVGMKRLPSGPRGAQERRERYYELRRNGMRMVDAAAAVGVTTPNVINNYER